MSPKDVLDVAEPSSANGRACYVMVAVNVSGMSGGERAALVATSTGVLASMPACPAQPAAAPAPGTPGTPGGARAPAPAPVRLPSPGTLATRFWDTIPLPHPHPVSRPDYAITGKRTYVSTGDTNRPAPWTKPTPFGTLSITAVGTYTVQWGDGTTSGPYSTTGGPYPSGTITHTYDNTGTVTITVTEQWHATWRIGAFHGTLGGLHTTGDIPGFVVRQLQAVITQSQ